MATGFTKNASNEIDKAAGRRIQLAKMQGGKEIERIGPKKIK